MKQKMKKGNENTGGNKGLKKIITTILSLIIVAIASFLGFGGENTEEAEYSDPVAIVSEEACEDMEDADAAEDVYDEEEISYVEDVEEEEASDIDEAVAEEDSAEDVSSEETVSEEEVSEEPELQEVTVAEITFRNEYLLDQHYDKHGIEMGFNSAEEYELAAYKVIINPDALHKIESEDGDDVYYVEATNEFVVVSQDGYIRTYFNPNAGIDYYNRQ